MALNLTGCLREARSLPVFSGTDSYSLANFIRDVNSVLLLTAKEYKPLIQTILANRLQGKVMSAVETLRSQV